MRKLTVNEKEYLIPGEWNELKFLDLLEVCRIMLLPLDESYKRVMLLGYFSEIKYKELKHWSAVAFAETLSIFDYLFKESRLTKNPFPAIGKMKGPEPGLTNFTFEQYFSESESYYYLTVKNGNGSDLDKLINVMYNYKGNANNEGNLLALSEVEKLAIFYYYQGCTGFIKFKFPEVFKKSGSDTKIDGLEFTRLVNSLNQGDMSKNEALKDTNLYEALIHLTSIISNSNQ